MQTKIEKEINLGTSVGQEESTQAKESLVKYDNPFLLKNKASNPDRKALKSSVILAIVILFSYRDKQWNFFCEE